MSGIMMAAIGGFSPISVTIPPSVYAIDSSTSPPLVTVTTSSVSSAVAGGLGTYSYAWTQVDGDAISAVSPSGSSTMFQASSMFRGEERVASFRLTVTDAVTGQTASALISVDIARAGSGGGGGSG